MIMIAAAIMPVVIKTKSMDERILPRRLTLDIPATAEAMEKNTRGIMAVKRRFRKTSPKGFKKIVSFFRIMPNKEPIPMATISRRENL